MRTQAGHHVADRTRKLPLPRLPQLGATHPTLVGVGTTTQGLATEVALGACPTCFNARQLGRTTLVVEAELG